MDTSPGGKPQTEGKTMNETEFQTFVRNHPEACEVRGPFREMWMQGEPDIEVFIINVTGIHSGLRTVMIQALKADPTGADLHNLIHYSGDYLIKSAVREELRRQWSQKFRVQNFVRPAVTTEMKHQRSQEFDEMFLVSR